jgi:hypothetical protein
MKRLMILAVFVSGACFAQTQDRDVERALIQRQQQSDEFSLQLRQSQQKLQLSPGDLNQLQHLESRHLSERQRLENLGAEQLTRPGLDRQTAERERRMELQGPLELRLPPPQVRAPVTPRLRDPAPYFPSYD